MGKDSIAQNYKTPYAGQPPAGGEGRKMKTELDTLLDEKRHMENVLERCGADEKSYVTSLLRQVERDV